MYPRDETKAGVVRSQGRVGVVGRLGSEISRGWIPYTPWSARTVLLGAYFLTSVKGSKQHLLSHRNKESLSALKVSVRIAAIIML